MVNVSNVDTEKVEPNILKKTIEKEDGDTMDGVMSPSDVAVMMSKDGDGWGNGMGFMWIFALLILANGGFGGFGNNAAAALGYENLATSNELQRGFDAQNSMANEREILATINQNSLQGMQNANQNTQYMMGMFNDKYNELQRDIAGVAMAQQQTMANQQECCCGILRATDGINYNMAMNTAAINANTTAQTQRILDAINGSEMQRLREQNQMLQTAQMLNPIENRLNMVPTYPNTFAYNAGANPFCNCMC